MFYDEKFSVYVFPAISVSALSCEIALKNHIFNEYGKLIKAHKLDKLFKKMGNDKQYHYKNTTIKFYNMSAFYTNSSDRIDEISFDVFLKENANAFVEWRYIYESPRKVDLDFLEALLFALNDCDEDEYYDFLKQTRKAG